MFDPHNPPNCSLAVVITQNGAGSRIISSAKQKGLSGGTAFIGRGTISNPLLEAFGLYDIRKEIVLLAGFDSVLSRALGEMNREFKFCKPNHGIAFRIPLTDMIGCHTAAPAEGEETIGGIQTMEHQAVFIVVERGAAERVMEVARAAGAKGGTIVHARGAGASENEKLFSMEIEPEKEILLILAEKSAARRIVDEVTRVFHIEQPGNGVLFTADAGDVYGLA